jgi:hypothetical protein
LPLKITFSLLSLKNLFKKIGRVSAQGPYAQTERDYLALFAAHTVIIARSKA